ncbi:DEAD/DEAH box helicase [Metabacillus fastidiosus]|uniref:DEAD/DEAH box helicase n=1 Tax=Metabacillus fastidiosus TaxID=1458 RepID=UPI003D27DCF8
MSTTLAYLKEWQEALQIEIHYLKKYGSTKYYLKNGQLLSSADSYPYYFETNVSIKIPPGSQIRLEWGNVKIDGRMLSSEGKNIIVALEQSIGDLVGEAVLFHDPWELLDELQLRLEEIEKSKRKLGRIKRLMNPDMGIKHPVHIIKNNVHELILRSKYNPVTYVWGPPGTGKTYTLARVAANKYFKEKRVLILSHSNQAVDVLLAEISTFIKKRNKFQEGHVIRYGSQTGGDLLKHESLTTAQLLEKREPSLAKEKEQLIEEKQHLKNDLTSSFSKRDSDQLLDIEKKLTRLLEKIRQKEIQFVKDAYVIGTTLAKAATDPTIYEHQFDVVIIDEASMCYVPQAAFAATLAKHSIICGDFKQLPPIASSRHELVNKWLKEDIFHCANVAHTIEHGQLHPHLMLLKEQRRMHPDISAFTNKYIYRSLVGDHESVLKNRNEIVEKAPFPNRAAILVDTSSTGEHCINERASKSRMNIWQLLLSFQLIHEAYKAGARSIGYVSPYRVQAQLMDSLLTDFYEEEKQTANIIAATVHKLQGSERDVIIFDTVDSYPEQRAGMLITGKESERLINVAITRTKGKFIHVSNNAYIHQHVYGNKTIKQLVTHQEKDKQTVSMNEIGTWIKNQHERLQWMHARKLERVFDDMKKAQKSIIISLPAHTVLTEQWLEKLTEMRNIVTVISDKQYSFQPRKQIEQFIPFPFILIDHRYFWLCLPLEGSKNISPPFVAARLDSVFFAEQFLGKLPIDFT